MSDDEREAEIRLRAAHPNPTPDPRFVKAATIAADLGYTRFQPWPDGVFREAGFSQREIDDFRYAVRPD